MAIITISDGYSVVYDTIDTDKWDLDNPIARIALWEDVLFEVQRADAGEKQETERRTQGWREAGYTV